MHGQLFGSVVCRQRHERPTSNHGSVAPTCHRPERERDQSIRLATQEERAKIAWDIHDIVAHSLSVIVVQADGGAYLAHHEEAGDIETRLSASGQALDTIATTARHALDETRRLVGVLRDNDAGPQLSPLRALTTSPTSSGR